MFRSSRNIALTLLGSAALAGCCLTSCVQSREEPERDANGNFVRDANGNPVYHRHYYFHPWFGYGGYHSYGYPLWHGSSYTSSPSGVSSGTTARPSSGVTSRGGFGATGHATAGG
jgi:hypothetical protein